MAGINKVFLAGNVGRDPEMRQFGEGGQKLASFSLATSRGGYVRNDGEPVPERTQWHDIRCWGTLATVVERYVRKGDRLAVVGRIEYNKYTGNDGVERRMTNIVAEDIFLGGRQQASSDSAEGMGNSSVARQGEARVEREQPMGSPKDGHMDSLLNDDLPF